MPYQYRNQHTGMSHHETAHASAGIVFLFYIALFAFIGTINGLLELIIAGAAIAAIEYIIQNFLGFPDGILLIALYVVVFTFVLMFLWSFAVISTLSKRGIPLIAFVSILLHFKLYHIIDSANPSAQWYVPLGLTLLSFYIIQAIYLSIYKALGYRVPFMLYFDMDIAPSSWQHKKGIKKYISDLSALFLIWVITIAPFFKLLYFFGILDQSVWLSYVTLPCDYAYYTFDWLRNLLESSV